MMAPIYHHLTPLGDACAIPEEFLERAKATWLCGECGNPRTGVGAVDIQIEEEEPVGAPLTFPGIARIIIAREDFIASLNQDAVAKYLRFGSVFGPQGNKIPGWLTVRANNRVMVRGSRHARHRVCTTCGKHIYFALGKRYLYPTPDVADSILESQSSGLVVLPEVMKDVRVNRWRALGVQTLKVEQKDKDGFGILRID